jgi:glutathione peroxidase
MRGIGWMLILSFVSVLAVHGYAQDNVPAGVHSFLMKMNDGQDKSLADYQGKVLLIVNTASKCGYTPQLGSMQKLYEQYKDRGLEVLAFPANNFMGQEPGTNEEIKNFCLLKYNATFPLFAKISVKGDDIDPLYSYLTEQSPFPGAISWNFNKFLVDAQGNVVARYPSAVDPMSEQITQKIDELLPQGTQ